jgi:type III pantothenate kinase
MNLCIDFGNTYSKLAFFNGKQLLGEVLKLKSAEVFDYISNSSATSLSVCSVTKSEQEILNDFAPLNLPIFWFNYQSKLPITNNYGTPATLGPDRLAAAIGAQTLYPQQNVLIIDMGTCIKYDLVLAGSSFEGGIIAPGLHMRLKSMHSFTKKLPLIETWKSWPNLVGKSTQEAILSGVLNGILAEMEGIISKYQDQLTNIKIILCGGDAIHFESRLKYTNFVVPALVLHGLNAASAYQNIKK